MQNPQTKVAAAALRRVDSGGELLRRTSGAQTGTDAGELLRRTSSAQATSEIPPIPPADATRSMPRSKISTSEPILLVESSKAHASSRLTSPEYAFW